MGLAENLEFIGVLSKSRLGKAIAAVHNAPSTAQNLLGVPTMASQGSVKASDQSDFIKGLG